MMNIHPTMHKPAAIIKFEMSRQSIVHVNETFAGFSGIQRRKLKLSLFLQVHVM